MFDYFWVSYDNQIRKSTFWIIINKICLHQEKMNGNDAIIFWYFERINLKAFKRVVIDSETINGSVDTGKAVIAQILKKSQWHYNGKKLT